MTNERIEFLAGEKNAALLRLVEYASDGGELLCASLVGSASETQAARAMISGRNTCCVRVSGLKGLRLAAEKYTIRVQRLPLYNQAHMVIRANCKNLVVGPRREALESYLLGDQIDTPLLPGWVDWVVSEIEKHEGVRPLSCSSGLEAYRCIFKSNHVDEIVSEGIRSGKLELSTRHARAA